jgi:hypothetical protein
MADPIDYGDFADLVPGAKPAPAQQFGEFADLVPKTSAMDDIATSAKKGVVGVGEAVVGVADLASAGRAGKALQDAGVDLKGTQQSLSDDYSPEMKRQQAYVGEAQGFWDAARRAATSPRFAANAIVESIPSMVAGGFAGRGFQAMGAGRALAAGLGEGSVMAGQHAEQNRQNNAQGLLDEKGYTESAIAGVGGALFGALGGKLDNALGVWNPDGMFLKGARKAVEGRMMARVGKGSAIEAGEEAGQSYVETVGENYAKGKPLTEGAAEQAGVGAAVGGLMGAGGGVMPGHHRPNVDVQPSQQNDPSAVAPVGPLSAASEVGKASGAVQGAQAPGGDPGAPQAPSGMGGTRGLIAEAAQRNGVDPKTALVISAIETGGRFNADAKNPRSSAQGHVPVHGRHAQDVPRGHARDVARPEGAGRVRREVHRRHQRRR